MSIYFHLTLQVFISIIINIFFNVSCKLLLMDLLSLKKNNKLHYIDRIYSFGFEEAFRDTPHQTIRPV